MRKLTTFAEKYPGIAVHVRELANLELLECVRRREVKFGDWLAFRKVESFPTLFDLLPSQTILMMQSQGGGLYPNAK